VLTEADIDTAMREVRIALLEADVACLSSRNSPSRSRKRRSGRSRQKHLAAQMVIKLVQDHLTELLGSEQAEINLNAPACSYPDGGPAGSGKTTSTGKLALRLKTRYRKKVLVASLDIYRPAAQQQLEVLADRRK